MVYENLSCMRFITFFEECFTIQKTTCLICFYLNKLLWEHDVMTWVVTVQRKVRVDILT